MSGDPRRLRAVPSLAPEVELLEADADAGKAGDTHASDAAALGARAAGRRAVVPRPRELAPHVARSRTTVPAGLAAQRALRRRLQERLADATAAEGATGARSFSLAVVEVDATSTGHADGRERLLTALGSRLADVTRPSDLVVRPEPHRFVIVLGGTRDTYALAAARRRISDVLSRPVLIDGRPVRSSVAVGVLPATSEDSVDGLLARLPSAATRDRRSARRLRSVAVADPAT
jgi:GGDEF domain-containing protein